MSDGWKYFLGFLSAILIAIINGIGRIIIRHMELKNEIKKIIIKSREDIPLMSLLAFLEHRKFRKKIKRKNNGNYIKEGKKHRKNKRGKNEKRISNK